MSLRILMPTEESDEMMQALVDEFEARKFLRWAVHHAPTAADRIAAAQALAGLAMRLRFEEEDYEGNPKLRVRQWSRRDLKPGFGPDEESS